MRTTVASDGTSWLLYIATGLALTGIVLLFVMIVAFAVPVFFSAGGSPFSWVWMPSQGDFGILPMICGSLLLSLSALGLAWPLALGLCCWLYQWGNTPLAVPVRGVVQFMTAIPTVVYGFSALFLLTPLIRDGLARGTGLCWLTATLVLTLLILPTMVLVLEAGLRPKLDALHLRTVALGFTRMQTCAFLVLPGARSTLLTAAVLGFGRAIGDTLVSLMLAGNAPHVPHALDESLRTLTAHMALVTANEVGGAAYGSLFVAGMLLLVINAGVSLGLRRLGQAYSQQKGTA
ncbi:MAG: ABC transporter permease subunit [Bilophila sp.]